MYNSNRGSVSNHYDSNDDSHRGYRDRPPRNTEEDHKGDYRRRDSKGRRRNRWDDEERDSSSSSRNRDKDREYRRHWRDRSRSPVDKQKSPSFRVSKDIFENTEAKKEDSKSRRNNWSESSSDEESGKLRRGNPPYAGDSGSNQYSKSQGSFPVAADVYSNNDKNGNSLSKPNFYQHFSSHNYPVPQQSSEASRIDQTRSMGNLSFPVPAASEISDSKTKIPAAGIQIRLLPQPVKASPVVKPVDAKPKTALKIASVFNVDDDDDEEEMPAECKMRMKNIGRETPTSAGPNSFGKTKIGFCNMATIKERRLQEDILKKK